MRLRTFVTTLTAATFLLSAAALHAEVFTATGIFADATSLSGTVTIDTVAGTVDAADLFVSTVGEFNLLTNAGTAVNFDFSGHYLWDGVDLGAPDLPAAILQLDIYLGTSNTLVGYSGGPLCVDLGDFTGNCGVYISYYDRTSDPNLTSGSLAPASEVPEPSSAFLAAPAAWFVLRRRSRL